MEEKSYVEDIDRSIYDIRDDEKDAYKLKEGLTPEIVEQISKEKNDPVWIQVLPPPHAPNCTSRSAHAARTS